MKNAVDANAAGVSSEIWDASDQSLAEGVLGKSTGQFSAGVYGWADHSEGSNRWAAYFNGPVRIKHLSISNFSDGNHQMRPFMSKDIRCSKKPCIAPLRTLMKTSIEAEGNGKNTPVLREPH